VVQTIECVASGRTGKVFASEKGLRAIFEDVELSVKGVAASVKLGDEDEVSKLEKKCRRHGLIIVGEEDEIMLFPPCNVEEKTVDEALEIIEACRGSS
jgi:adenosylmethionine-8-amino-7-oxononanoate aminotransferase